MDTAQSEENSSVVGLKDGEHDKDDEIGLPAVVPETKCHVPVSVIMNNSGDGTVPSHKKLPSSDSMKMSEIEDENLDAKREVDNRSTSLDSDEGNRNLKDGPEGDGMRPSLEEVEENDKTSAGEEYMNGDQGDGESEVAKNRSDLREGDSPDAAPVEEASNDTGEDDVTNADGGHCYVNTSTDHAEKETERLNLFSDGDAVADRTETSEKSGEDVTKNPTIFSDDEHIEEDNGCNETSPTNKDIEMQGDSVSKEKLDTADCLDKIKDVEKVSSSITLEEITNSGKNNDTSISAEEVSSTTVGEVNSGIMSIYPNFTKSETPDITEIGSVHEGEIEASATEHSESAKSEDASNDGKEKRSGDSEEPEVTSTVTSVDSKEEITQSLNADERAEGISKLEVENSEISKLEVEISDKSLSCTSNEKLTSVKDEDAEGDEVMREESEAIPGCSKTLPCVNNEDSNTSNNLNDDVDIGNIKEIIGEKVVQDFDEDSFDLNINITASSFSSSAQKYMQQNLSMSNILGQNSTRDVSKLGQSVKEYDTKLMQPQVLLERVDIGRISDLSEKIIDKGKKTSITKVTFHKSKSGKSGSVKKSEVLTRVERLRKRSSQDVDDSSPHPPVKIKHSFDDSLRLSDEESMYQPRVVLQRVNDSGYLSEEGMSARSTHIRATRESRKEMSMRTSGKRRLRVSHSSSPDEDAPLSSFRARSSCTTGKNSHNASAGSSERPTRHCATRGSPTENKLSMRTDQRKGKRTKACTRESGTDSSDEDVPVKMSDEDVPVKVRPTLRQSSGRPRGAADYKMKERSMTHSANKSTRLRKSSMQEPSTSYNQERQSRKASGPYSRNLKVYIDQSEWRKWTEVADDENFQPSVILRQLPSDVAEVRPTEMADDLEDPETASTSAPVPRTSAPLPSTSAPVPSSSDLGEGLSRCKRDQPTVLLHKTGLPPRQWGSGSNRVEQVSARDYTEALKMRKKVKLVRGLGYKCTICEKFYMCRKSLSTHMKIHAPVKQYTCEICLREFSLRKYYVQHKSSHARNLISNKFCYVCHETFESETRLSEHVKKHGAIYMKTVLMKGGSKDLKTRESGEAKSITSLQQEEGKKCLAQESKDGIQKSMKLGMGVPGRASSIDSMEKHNSSGENRSARMKNDNGGQFKNFVPLSRAGSRASFNCGRIRNKSAKPQKIMKTKPTQEARNTDEETSEYSLQKTEVKRLASTEETQEHKYFPKKYIPKLCRHVCEICGKFFSTYALLRRHMEFHQQLKQNKCSKCQKQFLSSKMLKLHLQTHTLSGHIKCQNCGESFTRVYVLQQHLQTHSDTAAYLCSVCGDLSRNKTMSRIHARKHNSCGSHKCAQCQRIFKTSYQKRRHMKSKCNNNGVETNGKNVESFFCKQCNQKFNSRVHCVAHKLKHSDIFPFHCQLCPRKFAIKSALSAHKSIHAPFSQFRCMLCEKTTSNKDAFVYHWMRKHEGRKCIICHRYFSVHKGERSGGESSGNNLCKRCVHCFGISYQIRLPKIKMLHMKTWFSCKLCQKLCNSKFRLRLHLQRHLTDSVKTRVNKVSKNGRVQQMKNKTNLIEDQEGEDPRRKLRSSIKLSGSENEESSSEPATCNGNNDDSIKRHKGKLPLRKVLKTSAESEGDFSEAFSNYSDSNKSDEDDDKEQIGSKWKKSQRKSLPFLCDKCGKRFPANYYLQRHISGAHKYDGLELEVLKHRNKPMDCRLCGARFSCLYSVERHMRRAHKGKSTNDTTCSICGKIFYNKFNMMRHNELEHLRSSTSDKEEEICVEDMDLSEACKCLKCEHVFRHRRNLYLHLHKMHNIELVRSHYVCLTPAEYLHYLEKQMKMDPQHCRYQKCKICQKIVVLSKIKRHMQLDHGHQPMASGKTHSSKSGKQILRKRQSSLKGIDDHYDNRDTSSTQGSEVECRDPEVLEDGNHEVVEHGDPKVVECRLLEVLELEEPEVVAHGIPEVVKIEAALQLEIKMENKEEQAAGEVVCETSGEVGQRDRTKSTEGSSEVETPGIEFPEQREDSSRSRNCQFSPEVANQINMQSDIHQNRSNEACPRKDEGKHADNVDLPDAFKCAICGRISRNFNGIFSHLREKHETRDKSNILTVTLSEYNAYMEKEMAGKISHNICKQFRFTKCETCGKVFREAHMKNHAGLCRYFLAKRSSRKEHTGKIRKGIRQNSSRGEVKRNKHDGEKPRRKESVKSSRKETRNSDRFRSNIDAQKPGRNYFTSRYGRRKCTINSTSEKVSTSESSGKPLRKTTDSRTCMKKTREKTNKNNSKRKSHAHKSGGKSCKSDRKTGVKAPSSAKQSSVLFETPEVFIENVAFSQPDGNVEDTLGESLVSASSYQGKSTKYVPHGRITNTNGSESLQMEKLQISLECEVCGKSFKYNKSLINHLQLKHGARQMNGSVVPGSIKDAPLNPLGIENVENDDSMSEACKCAWCGSVFLQLQNLHSHLLKVHNILWKESDIVRITQSEYCSTIEKQLVTSSSYMYNRYRKCQFCQKVIYQSNMKRHIEQNHTEEANSGDLSDSEPENSTGAVIASSSEHRVQSPDGMVSSSLEPEEETQGNLVTDSDSRLQTPEVMVISSPDVSSSELIHESKYESTDDDVIVLS